MKHKHAPGWNEFMCGSMIEPMELGKKMSVADLMKVYSRMGFNARRLAEACELYGRMIDSGATIAMTVTGAMAPVGMSGAFSQLIEAGFIDWVISTGANLYHDMHRAFDLPMRQGRFDVDDNELYDAGIARIYDVFIGDRATLVATDEIIVQALKDVFVESPISTADLHYLLGRYVEKKAPQADKSFLVKAMQLNVPVYTSSPGDSSIGINLIVNFLRGNRIPVDPTLDVLETAALVRSAAANGVIVVGGGSPKNFYLQTQPTLWQILNDNRGGHDYFVQITTDSPQWGGLSGATPSEARSWGKIKDAQIDNVVVYSDATIAFPLLAAYALETRKPRRRKELYMKKEALLDELASDYHRRNPHGFPQSSPVDFQRTMKQARENRASAGMSSTKAPRARPKAKRGRGR